MRLRLLCALILSALGVMALNSARADDGPWEVRLRAVYLSPENESDAIAGLVPENAITKVRVSTVHINPFLYGVGFGYRFGGH
jgi:outer membrane protein W